MGTTINNLTDKINISVQNMKYVSKIPMHTTYVVFVHLYLCLQLKSSVWLQLYCFAYRREFQLVIPGTVKVLFFLLTNLQVDTAQKMQTILDGATTDSVLPYINLAELLNY